MSYIWVAVWESRISKMILTRENWNIWRKVCPNATLFTTNPTLIGLGSNLDFCNGRLATNKLNQATCQKIHSLNLKLGVNKPQSLNCHTTSPIVLRNETLLLDNLIRKTICLHFSFWAVAVLFVFYDRTLILHKITG